MRKPVASLERIFKGLANGRRLQILRLLKVRGSLSLEAVARHCGVESPTACEHARKLRMAGLVYRKRLRHSIGLELTERGQLALALAPRLELSTARPCKAAEFRIKQD
ncbi:MAG: helix-turn-helix domain-containing protein [Verrucomicrobia bacterium]|nr:helix-turn-helix domain-containing protein [Verrucomicrobiota bacterium]